MPVRGGPPKDVTKAQGSRSERKKSRQETTRWEKHRKKAESQKGEPNPSTSVKDHTIKVGGSAKRKTKPGSGEGGSLGGGKKGEKKYFRGTPLQRATANLQKNKPKRARGE